MRDLWIHVGRLWTNGEPFLAVDAAFRGAWHGFSNDEFDQVVRLSVQETSVPVGTGQGLVVGADGVVRDDSWIEVFQAAGGAVALVQGSGPDYPGALTAALDYPDAEDQDGETLEVGSGRLAIFSAAEDGAGPYSTPLLTARAGPVPAVHGRPSDGIDQGLLLSAAQSAYRLKVRWHTRIDEDSCFARWLLIPVKNGG